MIGAETVRVTATVTVTVTGARAKALTTPTRQRSSDHGFLIAIRRRRTPPVLPPSQELSVLGRQRAQDRPQGRQAAAALRFGTREDRSEPHHGGFSKEAARARPGDQARAFPGAVALRDPLGGPGAGAARREGAEGEIEMEVILLERVARLGQMGEVVRVKDGFARNFLLRRGKALRATAENRTRFETMKSELEARSLTLKGEAAVVADKLNGKKFTVLRQASEAGQLFGSVSPRDLVTLIATAGFTVNRSQIVLNAPIKTIGQHPVQ